jgi:hypothetical protein
MIRRVEENRNGIDVVLVYDESGRLLGERYSCEGVTLDRDFYENGDIKETYATRGKVVSKKGYEKARLQYCPHMPEANSEFDHIGKVLDSLKGAPGKNKKARVIRGVAHRDDTYYHALIKDGLNIQMDKKGLGWMFVDKSKRETSGLLGRLWRAGAVSLTALATEQVEDGILISEIVVELPADPDSRKRLMKIIGNLVNPSGVPPSCGDPRTQPGTSDSYRHADGGSPCGHPRYADWRPASASRRWAGWWMGRCERCPPAAEIAVKSLKLWIIMV